MEVFALTFFGALILGVMALLISSMLIIPAMLLSLIAVSIPNTKMLLRSEGGKLEVVGFMFGNKSIAASVIVFAIVLLGEKTISAHMQSLDLGLLTNFIFPVIILSACLPLFKALIPLKIISIIFEIGIQYWIVVGILIAGASV